MKLSQGIGLVVLSGICAFILNYILFKLFLQKINNNILTCAVSALVFGLLYLIFGLLLFRNK